MEDREKRREKWKDMFLVGVWLDGGKEKNLVGFGCFLPKPTKMFFTHTGEKTGEKMFG